MGYDVCILRHHIQMNSVHYFAPPGNGRQKAVDYAPLLGSFGMCAAATMAHDPEQVGVKCRDLLGFHNLDYVDGETFSYRSYRFQIPIAAYIGSAHSFNVKMSFVSLAVHLNKGINISLESPRLRL